MAATLLDFLFPTRVQARKIAEIEFAKQELLLRFVIGELDQFKFRGELIALNRQLAA